MTVITYEMAVEGGEKHTFPVDLDRAHHTRAAPSDDCEWTRLEYRQCHNCPLSVSEATHCPAAVDVKSIADEFHDISSITRVDVWVHTQDRSYFKQCDAQQALMSLFGLVMATGACPILGKLEPLARYHLPFATIDETTLRVVGVYLIKQRARYQEHASDPDWDLKGIEDFYGELNTVNAFLIDRLRSVSTSDANGNAINVFCSIASLMQMGIDERLEGLIPLAKDLL